MTDIESDPGLLRFPPTSTRTVKMRFHRWGDRMDLYDGRRPRTRRSMSHEDHTFETWTDWDKEDRTEADRRINREMIEWKKGVLDQNYGTDEGHGSK